MNDESKQFSQRRFSGISRLYGEVAYQNFSNSHVCIIGLGGVGSWVVEGLVRSGMGQITLIDMDHVAESNINRQCQATDLTLGKAKNTALKERIYSINPECKVNEIDDFISLDNQEELLTQGYDWVVDCIDNFRIKASLIAYCRRNKIKLLTIGGAGGMVDPAKIKVADLVKSVQDPLLSQTRRLLRQKYNFPTNLSRRFHIPCVFSGEYLMYPDGKGGTSSEKPAKTATSGLNCAGGFGSSVCVTAPFGFFAAGYVLRKLAHS